MSKVRTTETPITRAGLRQAEYGPQAGSRASAPWRVALAYPSTYHVGMSSLGFQIVLQLLQTAPGVCVERFFMDTLDGGSLESGAPLRDFDLIAISAAYELDAPHILDLIEHAGFPLAAAERGEADGAPLILLGGVLASLNRLPLYPFIDLFAHGEAEGILPPLLAALTNARERRLSRAETLLALRGLSGLEITAGALAAAGLDALAEPPAPPPCRVTVPELNGSLAASAILTPHTEFSNMGLIDLARGCPNHCTFCWVGRHAPAYRIRPVESVLEHVAALAPFTDRFGLVASAVGAHPGIDAICEEIIARGHKVSYSSLRVEEVTPAMLRALAAGGQKSATLAPEAGSRRVRRLLGKRLGDEQIFDAAEQVFGLGLESLKLYFMIGVPTETDEEALEIAAFVEKIREIMLRWARPRGRIGSIGVNLGIYVPKPGLPLNKLPAPSAGAVKNRLKLVVRRLERIPNIHLNAASVDQAYAQGVLSMGGIEAADYIQLVRAHTGNWRAANRVWQKSGNRWSPWATE